jgi:hypothetical protein
MLLDEHTGTRGPRSTLPATRKKDRVSDYIGKAARRKIISMTTAEDLREWCKSLGCTPEELREAVDHAGTATDMVSEYLRAKKRRARRLRESKA